MYKFLDWIDTNKIYCYPLAENKSDKIVYILEKNLDKLDWWSLSKNENVIHILEKNLDAACIEKTCLFYS
jgi:hypothetical protein